MSFTQSVGFTNLLTATSLIGKGMSAYGTYQASQSEASINEFNARVKQQEAKLVREKAKFDLVIEGEKSRRAVATAQAQFAGRGVRSLVGTPADVLSQIAEAGEMNMLAIQFNADIDELNALSEAQVQLLKADQTRTAGKIDMFSTILGATPLLQQFKFKKKAPARTPTQKKMTPSVSGATAFA
jgi:hypothetical protein